MTTSLDVESLVDPDGPARAIANKWHEWKNARANWEKERKELRNYVYATDTNTTTNSKLPWLSLIHI